MQPTAHQVVVLPNDRHVSLNRVRDVIEQLHDALDMMPLIHHERRTGFIGETPANEVAMALLAAGWIPPKR